MTLQEFIEKAKAKHAEQSAKKQSDPEKVQAFLEKIRKIREQQSK